jgi:ATP-dependent DNA ligase
MAAMRADPTSKKRTLCIGKVAIAVAQLYLVRMLQRTLPAGFIAPCLPIKADRLPSGGQWLHEIKHDGFRVTGSAFYRLALACGEARPS